MFWIGLLVGIPLWGSMEFIFAALLAANKIER